jgi:hypothetical protein
MLALIIAFSIFTPANDDSDLSPTTYNSGSAGTKAAYLLLGELGYGASRWEVPSGDLRNVDAAKATLILAEPNFPIENANQVQGDIADFLSRGGRVLATGKEGAYFLPGAKTEAPARIYQKLCFSTPEGQGPLARVGKISLADSVRWADLSTAFRVSQLCGNDAVVVSYKYGEGEAVWWSSPMPLTNRGLKDDASLKLVLASVGGMDRRILFDEYFHGQRASLLVLSFGRRNGPLRLPVTMPRSSPLEFAESMGRLYRKAGATQAAVDGARRRLLKFLEEQCGVPREVLRSTPSEIAEAVVERLGGRWTRIGEHLSQAAEVEHGTVALASTLELVKALDRDRQDLSEAIRVGHPERMI